MSYEFIYRQSVKRSIKNTLVYKNVFKKLQIYPNHCKNVMRNIKYYH